MEKFTYKNYENCSFETSKYFITNNKGLMIVNDEGHIATCSVNGSRVLNADEIGIKNWSENVGMVNFLVDMGIIDNEPFSCEDSGWVQILYFKLTEKGKALWGE